MVKKKVFEVYDLLPSTAPFLIFIFPAVEVMGWAWSGGWFAGSVQQCGG